MIRDGISAQKLRQLNLRFGKVQIEDIERRSEKNESDFNMDGLSDT